MDARRTAWASLILLALTGACSGTRNVADCKSGVKRVPCDSRTKEEDAREALNDGDFDTAITLLDELVTDEPTDYARYPLLAAAYAARAGLQVLNLAKAQVGSSGGGLLDQFSTFIPGPAAVGADQYKLNVTDMNSACQVLRAIPSDLLDQTSGGDYATSATLQLTLYSAAYSVMFLNQFAVNPTTGQVDLDQLSQMSEDDALNVVANLAATGQIPGVTGSEAVQGQVTAALAAINAEPGDTTKDKLAAFIAAQQASGNSSTDTSTLTETSTATDSGTGTGAGLIP